MEQRYRIKIGRFSLDQKLKMVGSVHISFSSNQNKVRIFGFILPKTWTNTKFSIKSPVTKPLAGLQYHIEYLRHWIVCGCSYHVLEYALPSGKIFYKNDSFLPLKYCFSNALRLSEVKLSSKKLNT